MKFTYNWLKDFVEVGLRPQELAERLTMAGLEVTSLEKVGKDWVFETEVTSNRPDWLSVIGVAREVAAIIGKKLHLTQARGLNKKPTIYNPQPFFINIKDKKACPFYTARLITGVSVKPSPVWVQTRLIAVGLRPINNIVDITNYILMETGQPLHAFDYDKLIDRTIMVRRAEAGEKIVTIDGVERELDPSVLVIADKQRPVAVAGLMGGADTEVTQNTKNILLESAYFDPITTRRAARLLGLSSESSYRFERGVDLLGVEPASKKAAGLICNLAGGKEEGFKSYPLEIKPKKRKVETQIHRINKILNIKLAPEKIKTILNHLGFDVKLRGNKIIVGVPSFRPDVKEEADLIEELARCFGYNKIPSVLPCIKAQDIKADETEIINFTRQTLIRLNLNEVITFSLINRKWLADLNLTQRDFISIKNPLSQDQEILRPTLIPSILSCVSTNLNHNAKDIRIFEISHVFPVDNTQLILDESNITEPISITIALSGDKPFSWQDRARRKIDFFDLKGVVQGLLSQLGVKDFVFSVSKQPYFLSKVSADLKIGDITIAVLGEVDSSLLDKWDINKKEIFLAELSLSKLLPFINLSKGYVPVNRFPKVSRNLSLVASQNVTYLAIKQCIENNALCLLKDIKLIEQYKGEHIEKGFLGLTLLLDYQAEDSTLTDEEVNNSHAKICKSLAENLGIQVR